MRRPAVLHVVEHWSRPSERFVVDLIRSTTATRPVVAAHRRLPSPPPGWGGRVHDLSLCRDAASADAVLGALPAPVTSQWTRRLPLHAAVAALATVHHTAVLHAHFGTAAPAVWRAARRLARPFAVSLHGWDLLVGARTHPAVLDAVRAADLVVVPSAFLAAHARDAGVAPDALRVVPSGVELATLRWRERSAGDQPPVVTFIGRFVEKKGVLDVAAALAAVARTTPLRARFVGYGPLEPALRSAVASHGLAAEILDGRRRDVVIEALERADVVVTASRTAEDGDAETLGLVNIEAQACGVPLVATRHGGYADVVSPAAARLVDTDGDIAAGLATALRDLLESPDAWPAMSRAGRAHVAERFELGACTADLEELWLALAEGARTAALPTPRARQASDVRVSVVVVTHNRRALLERTLDALEAQTCPADEVVVVDNGSDDGTSELLDHRVSGSPRRLQVIRRHGNDPVAQGRNLAVAVCTGDVVAFTDDDCRPRPEWIETLLAGFREDVGVVQGRTVPDPAQPLGPLSRSQWTLAETGLYETCNVAYRRDVLADLADGGPFDVAFAAVVARSLDRRRAHLPFGEDAELAWRVKRRGVRSRFAPYALVDHEVWPPQPALLMQRAAVAAAFPALVSRVPELRARFLTAGVFLGPRRLTWWTALAAMTVAAGTRTPWLLVFTLPYADRGLGLRDLGRPGRRRDRLRALPTLLRRDVVETVALVRGSWRAGSVVL